MFAEGDTENTNFYFVLEGAVGVYISALARPAGQNELTELETPNWNPEYSDSIQMEQIENKLLRYGFAPEDICTMLPRCRFLVWTFFESVRGRVFCI